jgi:hypothetical protein
VNLLPSSRIEALRRTGSGRASLLGRGAAADPNLFLFIGADPNTTWLSGSGVALDANGFVLTGAVAFTINSLMFLRLSMTLVRSERWGQRGGNDSCDFGESGGRVGNTASAPRSPVTFRMAVSSKLPGLGGSVIEETRAALCLSSSICRPAAIHASSQQDA